MKVSAALAISGRAGAGVVIALRDACGVGAVFIVRDLSAAEIPVVTPCVDSVESVDAVSRGASCRLCISERPNCCD